MTRTTASPRNAFAIACTLIAVLLSLGVQTPTQATDIPVESEADYQVMLDAIRAAEYTRQNYLEDQPNPRAIAGIAGLWAFAEANPFATPAQLAAFISAYDTELASAVPGDPRLAKTGSVLSALIATRIDSNGALAGTDTRVGRRAIELLGIDLPGLDGYQESRTRMARYDLASVQRLVNRTETADALTAVLAGVDPAGNRIDGLAMAAADHLESLGLAPMLGLIDPDQLEVNAGLTGLPTYAQFIEIRDTEGAHLQLENEVFAGIDAVQANAMQLLDEIGIAEVQPNLALDSLALFAAANDPKDPNHAAALAQLEARRQAVIDSIRDTSDDRAAIFARTLILQQSSYPQVQTVATVSRDFAGLQIQTNNDLAVAQQSVDIVGSVVGIAAAYYSGDVWGGVQSAVDLVGGAIGLADLLGLGDAPPSVEEQIFSQIVELRQQVEDLRVQMNARFDIVDAKLDSIFETMIGGFNALGDQIGDLQDDVDDLAANLAEARTTLDRIEAALFGFAEDALLLPLSLQADLVLDYRNDSGVDLSYQNDNPNFVDSASFFYTYATTTSKSTTFAGPTTQQLTLDNAESTLSAQPIARSLNDLRRIPSGLFTTDGTPVVGPITAARVGAPAPWSQAAAAYMQLAQESPWYFAFLLQSQITERGGNAEIDDVIADGQRIVTLANATRNRADLFNGILQRAFDQVAIVESQIETILNSILSSRGLRNGAGAVDVWGSPNQVASSFVPRVSTVGGEGGSLPSTSFPHRGYEIVIADQRAGLSATFDRATLAEWNAIACTLDGATGNDFALSLAGFSGGSDFTFRITMSAGPVSAVRVFPAKVEARPSFPQGAAWGNLPVSGQSPLFYVDRLEEIWSDSEGGLRDALVDGDLTAATYPAGEVFFFPVGNYELRVRILDDFSTYEVSAFGFPTEDTLEDMVPYITEEFAVIRSQAQTAVLNEFGDNGSPIDTAGIVLDNTSALLEAYLTLGLADAMTQSELLRSATRGIPSADGLGFRTDDILSVLLMEIQQDEGEIGGSPGVDLPDLGAHMTERILGLSSEIDQVLGTDAPSFPYVEFVLAELRDLRENAFRLAIDDTYLAAGAISVDSADGLMANDVGQPGRINNQDLSVDLAFFSSPEHIAPASGSVVVHEDGSFHYTPDPGFSGTDSFTYRLIARVDDSPNPIGDPNVRSDPATVVIYVGDGFCPADVTGDGSIDLDDLDLVLTNFGQVTSEGDTNGDGVVNLDDLDALLTAFGTDCR